VPDPNKSIAEYFVNSNGVSRLPPSTSKAMFQADLDQLKGGCAEG